MNLILQVEIVISHQSLRSYLFDSSTESRLEHVAFGMRSVGIPANTDLSINFSPWYGKRILHRLKLNCTIINVIFWML